MSVQTSYVRGGGTTAFPRKMWQNTPHTPNCFSAAYQLVTGSTLCLASRKLVFAKEVLTHQGPVA